MRRLPLVEYVKSLQKENSLEKVCIIGGQHLLETTHTMLRSLFDRGLNPKNVSLLGKCYSTSLSVSKKMQTEGIDVCPSSSIFESHRPFDEFFIEASRRFLERKLSESNFDAFDKVILMDDGGYLLTLAQDLLPPHKIVGIEQTSSGYRRLQEKTLRFPVINVARSQAKLLYESPLIARAVMEKVKDRVKRLHVAPQQILVVGNGPIGMQIYSRLKSMCPIFLYDKNPAKSLLSKEEFLQKIEEVDMIIGCTGDTSIPAAYHPALKKGCVLISASSSDREFDAVHLRRKLPPFSYCHADIQVEGISLLNCGFPVNFHGGRHSIAPRLIQLTRALLASAIFQAQEMIATPQIVSLNCTQQKELISRYLKFSPAVVSKTLRRSLCPCVERVL